MRVPRFSKNSSRRGEKNLIVRRLTLTWFLIRGFSVRCRTEEGLEEFWRDASTAKKKIIKFPSFSEVLQEEL